MLERYVKQDFEAVVIHNAMKLTLCLFAILVWSSSYMKSNKYEKDAYFFDLGTTNANILNLR